MPTLSLPAFAQPRAVVAMLWQSRHSLFWRMVPTMFLASCFAALLLVSGATILEDARLREALAPDRLGRAFAAALQAAEPLPIQAGLPRSWCLHSLHVLSEDVLTAAMGDRTGDNNANGFGRAVDAGRLAVTLHGPSGGCTFGVNKSDMALQLQMEAATRNSGSVSGGSIIEQPDGWISVVTAAPKGNAGPVLTAGVHILSPLAKLMQPRSVFRPLAVFILSINALSALVLVVLLIRRIRKANRAAAAWTSGELCARIDDPGTDEFSRLTHQFDMMADAMAGVIQVKQALAAAEERNRVARDLHDSAKQRAFALNLQLSAAQQMVDPASHGGGLIATSLLLTNQLQQDLANVIRRLTAPTLVESGFRHVLTEAVGTMLARSQVHWSISLDQQDELLLSATPEVPRQLLLITVEAVANALKHAACTRCAISGKRDGALYIWRISDNGSGVPPAGHRVEGMGLANMKLRAAELPAGTFDILSGDLGGTVIQLTFRLTKPE